MNPIYTILESRHRWLILAAISLTAGSVGAIVILVYGWSQGFARVWFYAGAVCALYFLVRAVSTWVAAARGTADSPDSRRTTPR